MDVLMLSRIQFAAATFFHFIFVPLTLGMSILIAITETIYVRTGDENYKRLAKFWGKLFLINFAVGVVTGLTLEFQFGTNWSRYSSYVGDVFGSLLAIEATLAFFLESTFIAVWAFGWDRLSRRVHLAAIWLVALAANLSAVWILIANAWMQHPVGFIIRNGRAELTDFFAVVTQRFAWLQIVHTLAAAYVVAGFFVMGISAYQILRKHNLRLFAKSFKLAATFALIFSIIVVGQGHLHGAELAHAQPAKLAAMETHWETAARAPIYLKPRTNRHGPRCPQPARVSFRRCRSKRPEKLSQRRTSPRRPDVYLVQDHGSPRVSFHPALRTRLAETQQARTKSPTVENPALLDPPAIYRLPARLDRCRGRPPALDRLWTYENH